MNSNLSLKTKIFISLLCTLLCLNGGIFSALAVDPLRISNISVSPTDKTARITWYTNDKTDGVVEFEQDKYYDPNDGQYRYRQASSKTDSTLHSVTLINLIPDVKYHFRIIARSVTQEVQSFDQTFETRDLVDNTPPEITRVRAEYVTGTTATIQWDTNEPANSVVEYGFNNNYGKTASNSSRVITHDITITRLEPGRTYYYRVKSKDENNNTSIYSGSIFTTDINSYGEKETLYITDLKPISANDPEITENSAVISYRTSKLADCKVYYGTTTSYNKSISCPAPRNFFHSVTLSGLKSGTRYYFKVESKDIFGKKVIRDNLSFVTKGSGPATPSLGIVLGAEFVAVNENGLLLYSSFDTKLDADIAEGNSKASNYNGTITSQSTLAVQSLDLREGNKYLTYNSAGNINSQRGTITFWFRPNWAGDDKKGHTLLDLSSGSGSSSKSKYFFVDKDKDNNLRFWLENSNDSDFKKAQFNVSNRIQKFSWNHLAITWDYSSGSAILYLNGKKLASDNLKGSAFNFNPNIYLGGPTLNYIASAGTADALIDELKIYGRALTADEINSLADQSYIGVAGYVGGDDGLNGQILGASTLDYTQPKALYKEKDSHRIYAVYPNGQKHYIPSPGVFASYGYSWTDVQTVSSNTLDQYRDAHLVKTPNQSSVYYLYLDKMIRKSIPSPSVFNSYARNEWADIITISQEDLAFYPESKLVKDVDKEPIYYLENNTIREIKNQQVYTDLGLSKDSVALINNTHLNTFILGEPLE